MKTEIFTNLTNSKRKYPKIFYCPVCGLRFASANPKACPECSSAVLELDTEKAKQIANTHKRLTDKLYNLIKKQNKEFSDEDEE